MNDPIPSQSPVQHSQQIDSNFYQQVITSDGRLDFVACAPNTPGIPLFQKFLDDKNQVFYKLAPPAYLTPSPMNHPISNVPAFVPQNSTNGPPQYPGNDLSYPPQYSPNPGLPYYVQPNASSNVAVAIPISSNVGQVQPPPDPERKLLAKIRSIHLGVSIAGLFIPIIHIIGSSVAVAYMAKYEFLWKNNL